MLVQIGHVSPVSPLRFSPAGHQHFPLCDSTELRFAQNRLWRRRESCCYKPVGGKGISGVALASAVCRSHRRGNELRKPKPSLRKQKRKPFFPTESRSEPPPKASRICGVPLASAVFVRPRNHFRPSGLFLVFSQLWSDFSPHPVDFSPCRGLSRAKCFRCQMP